MPKNQRHPMMECVQMCQKCLRWFSLSTLKAIIYLFACLRGMFIIPRVLGSFFVSSETVT